MISVIQRCKYASVIINKSIISEIEEGILLLLGIDSNDQFLDADYLVKKIITLRIFDDDDNKMNLSIKDIRGSILVVSQFTLCASTKKGRRPSFINAASHEKGYELYNYFIRMLKDKKFDVHSGKFGAEMDIKLINKGPATFILDTKKNYNGC